MSAAPRLDETGAFLDAPAQLTNGAEPPLLEDIPVDAYADDPEAQEKVKRESQASEIVKFVLARTVLVHDENSDVYAIDQQTREMRHIERRSFRNWLQAEFYQAEEKSIRAQAYSEAIQTLAGIGLHKGELVEVYIRCAAIEGSYIIDLAEPGNSRAIRIDAGSWRIVDDPGVMFIRPDSLRPLPEPTGDVGDVGDLWRYANIPEHGRLLVLTWLMDCIRPDTPFPLLELLAEHGSAKSVTQSILRNIIDPSTAELRSAPKNAEDVFVGAGVGWLLAYDNVSHLSADLQDTLCRIATGATYATRKLYTNAEEVQIRAKRPISINGISASVTAQDLVDRTVSLEPPPIDDRREVAEIKRAFETAHPRILGGLLNIFSQALKRLPSIEIPRERRPRLIEYARLGCAVAEAMGGTAEEFLSAYETVREESVARTIDASPVAGALLEWLEGRPDRYGDHQIKQLFELLPRPHGGEAWPKSPKGFADALRRAAPALRTLGVLISRSRKSHGVKVVSITRRNTATQSPPCPPSPPPDGERGMLGTLGTSLGSISPDDREIAI